MRLASGTETRCDGGVSHDLDGLEAFERVARALGDATRVRMLALLMDGRALTAKELAYGAGVEPATATTHLARLAEAGLVADLRQGRHRYVRLRSPDVARAIESLMQLEPVAPALPRVSPALQRARFCYDHLAGELGTALYARLREASWLELDRCDGRVEVTSAGIAGLAALGVSRTAAARSRRPYACACLDWTERRDHLGGVLGATLGERFVALGWIARSDRTPRVVQVTAAGREAFARELGLALSA